MRRCWPRACARTGQTHLLELGAGAGGGTETVLAALRTQGQPAATITLTDLYPQPAAWADIARRTHGAIGYEPAPVDALAVPAQLAGFRAIFSAFHHFPPEAATAMLRDAVRAGTGIGVFEGAGKHWAELLLAVHGAAGGAAAAHAVFPAVSAQPAGVHLLDSPHSALHHLGRVGVAAAHVLAG